MDSQIVSDEEKLKLREWFIENEYDMDPQWKLLYRGSEEGFLALSWGQKCTEKHNVICIIESEHGNVFGGFTVSGWKAHPEEDYDVAYNKDSKAFLFLLRSVNGSKADTFPIKQDTSHELSATASERQHLTCFGNNGLDMAICDKCDENKRSWTGWMNEEWSYTTPTVNHLNGGKQYFKVKEIEMFINCKSI